MPKKLRVGRCCDRYMYLVCDLKIYAIIAPFIAIRNAISQYPTVPFSSSSFLLQTTSHIPNIRSHIAACLIPFHFRCSLSHRALPHQPFLTLPRKALHRKYLTSNAVKTLFPIPHTTHPLPRLSFTSSRVGVRWFRASDLCGTVVTPLCRHYLIGCIQVPECCAFCGKRPGSFVQSFHALRSESFVLFWDGRALCGFDDGCCSRLRALCEFLHFPLLTKQ